MEPYNIAQMADDTVLAADNESSLATKFECLRKFSDKKYQSINHTKTMYMHMSKFPRTQPIKCRDGTIINSLKYGNSIPYLGMHMTHTSKLEEIIKFNINKRMFDVAKYKSWLEVNKNTPFSVKLQVLDNCVLSAILYGSEVWGNLSFIKKKLISIEVDLLKSALRVKQGTPNELIYHELNRSEITSKLQDRQKTFIHRIEELDADDAVVKCVWVKCQVLEFSKYYINLLQNKDNKSEQNRNLRKNNLKFSERSMDKRYRDIIGLEEQNCIYDSFADDEYRAILSRWRLSNHKQSIETGR